MSVVFWRRTGERDFSYFETFWSEFKPENGQLAQNKADSKLTPAVFLLLCIVFVLYLNCICFALELYFHGKNSICVGLHRRFPILSSQFQGWTLVSGLAWLLFVSNINIFFLGICVVFTLYLYFTWIVFVLNINIILVLIFLTFGQLTHCLHHRANQHHRHHRPHDGKMVAWCRDCIGN